MKRKFVPSRLQLIAFSVTVATFILKIVYVKLVEERDSFDCLVPRGVGPEPAEVQSIFVMFLPILLFQIFYPNGFVYILANMLISPLVLYQAYLGVDNVVADYLRHEGIWQPRPLTCEGGLGWLFPESHGLETLFFIVMVDIPLVTILLLSLLFWLYSMMAARGNMSPD
jgi:hypothetical protein